MSRAQVYRGALEAVDRVVNRGGDADDVLRAVAAILHERAGYARAGVSFAGEGRLELGSGAGTPGGAPARFAVTFGGREVAALEVLPAPRTGDERAFLERVALLVSPYCSSAADSGGEARRA